MSVVVLHGLLYVLGGRSEFNEDDSSVEIYNPYTDTWEYRIKSSIGVVNINGGVVVNKFSHFTKKITSSSSSQTFPFVLDDLLELQFFHGACDITDNFF